MAVAEIGLSYSDFCALTPNEFSHIYDAYIKRRNAECREQWEQLRTLATIMVQPYAKKTLSPRKVLPLPWDNEGEQIASPRTESKEQRRRRFEEIMNRDRNH